MRSGAWRRIEEDDDTESEFFGEVTKPL